MKIKVLIVVCLASMLTAGYLWLAETSEPVKRSTHVQNRSTESVKPIENQLSLMVQVDSSIAGANQVVLSHSKLSWHMQLQPQTDEHVWHGLLSNIQYIQDAKVVPLVEQLPFSVRRKNNRFVQLDLLGLPGEHTLQVVGQIFNLLSYDIDQPLTYSDALRQVQYSYQQAGSEITRSIVKESYLDTQHQPKAEQEDWRLLMGQQGRLEKLNYTNKRVWEQQQQHYVVEQTVLVSKVPAQKVTLLASNANANAHLQVEVITEADIQITNQATLVQALEKLKDSLSSELAKVVGAYLIGNYNAFEIQALLSAQPQFSSAIIYALQKLQTTEAEAMLVDLLQLEQTADLDKHKVAMALGRFGSSSELSLRALESIAQQSGHQVANTALLSIGTMAHFSPEQAHNVALYLERNLTAEQNLATTVLAIGNSKDKGLLAQLPALLHGHDDGAKLNSIKVLSKHVGYQEEVVSALLSAPHPKYVAAFARTIMESGQPLSAASLVKLKQLQHTTNNPVVKNKLAELLSAQPT
ncbi:hypothetical protein [Pseudoalteromonas byunsanensis]|uniref:Uncharacterized protein n=1 Tax=Pseudoalteromonas byunsanensis TaxID=327939 RepID=A0A1S1N2S0_9GAMM|nr:hypothetical protein [Pseudoalteromonas byunsanensis]OHU93680.1 hypothetical protein BIW53_20305 [Pseudoalteromonas byunsanensis]